MIDQATELRKLVLRAMSKSANAGGPAPRLLLLTSGGNGIGVTTLGVNVSVALSEHGHRVVLVDADMSGGGAAKLCGLPNHAAVADLTVARRDIHEVLQRGPAGIQIIPGLRLDTTELELRPLAVENLVRQFAKLGRHADWVIVDVGHGASDLVRRLAQAADDIVVGTTADRDAIADAYAHIKLSLASHLDKLSLVVSMAEGDEQAIGVHLCIQTLCERFLGHGIGSMGHIPRDVEVQHAAETAIPFVLKQPGCPASRAVQRIAAELSARQRQQQSMAA